MRPILAFWILNVLLNRFNLHLCELGLFYKHPKGKREYLINTSVDEGLRFLKMNVKFHDFASMSLRTMFDTLEECPLYNKTIYAVIDKHTLPKVLKDQTAIPGYIDRIRRRYDDIKSNYRFSRSPLLYDYVIAYKYGNVSESKFSMKKTREIFIKQKINSDIIFKKYKTDDISQASILLDNFKTYIEIGKRIVYEQYIMFNDDGKIFAEFDKYLTKIKNPYSN